MITASGGAIEVKLAQYIPALCSQLGDHAIDLIGDQLFGWKRCKQLAGTLFESSVDR